MSERMPPKVEKGRVLGLPMGLARLRLEERQEAGAGVPRPAPELDTRLMAARRALSRNGVKSPEFEAALEGFAKLVPAEEAKVAREKN